MNDELNKKLAEWAGFKEQKHRWHFELTKRVFDWLFPDGQYTGKLPDFTQSLDACFKWIIYPNQGGLSNPPSNKIINWKFSDQQPNVGTYSKPRVWLSYCTLLDKGKNIWSRWQDSYAEDNSLALALCLAIEKLVDKGE